MTDNQWQKGNRMWIHSTAVIAAAFKLLATPPQGLRWEFAGFDEDNNIEFELVKDGHLE